MNHTPKILEDQEPQDSFHTCWRDRCRGYSMCAVLQRQDSRGDFQGSLPHHWRTGWSRMYKWIPIILRASLSSSYLLIFHRKGLSRSLHAITSPICDVPQPYYKCCLWLQSCIWLKCLRSAVPGLSWLMHKACGKRAWSHRSSKSMLSTVGPRFHSRGPKL